MNRLLLLVVPILLILNIAHADYTVTGLNTTVVLNPNSSAQVTEILTVDVNNQSVAQYTSDRIALNLTLSQWQNLIGPMLVEHIINPRSGLYHFNFLPGPLQNSNNGRIGEVLYSYTVNNVTTINQTGPRTYSYQFNDYVFNFQHAISGQVLFQNATLNIILPSGAKITSVYPLPDAPVSGFEHNYANVTQLSWFSGEPLSKFALSFTVQQSLESEVIQFFNQIYATFGNFIYLLIVVVIALLVIYTYLKVGK